MARSPPAAAAGSATEDDEEIDEIDLTQDTDEEDSASGVGMLSPVPVKAEPDAEPGPAGTHFKLRLRCLPVLTQWPCV